MNKLLIVFLVISTFGSALFAQNTSAEINREAERVLPQVIKWRRHLHQFPELSNREFKTAEFVERELRRIGLEVRTKIAKTGVVGILKGDLPGNVIGLRADMDGLPVTERVNIRNTVNTLFIFL